MKWKEISPNEIQDNPFTAVGKDWMLITAGNGESHNTMTASWGQMGIMWNKPVVHVYLRPQRYTKEFVEREDRFSVSFFNSAQYRPALNLLGTKSGRDSDKIAEAGLQVELFHGVPAFAQARLVLVCKKLYRQDLTADSFLDKGLIATHYPAGDYHCLYVGEIERVYTK